MRKASLRFHPVSGVRRLLWVWGLAACALWTGSASAFVWPFGGGPWPESSERPVEPLRHPTLERHLEELEYQIEGGFRIVAYGDQRALADGEWQALVYAIATEEARTDDPLPLLGVLDTGDIVDDGSHSDQFHFLTDLLEPLRAYPYLVGVGNHEVANNAPGPGRANTAAYLRRLDPELSVERLYYRKDVAGVSLLFLDTNDWVYGDDGEGSEALSPRGRQQMEWLREQLDDPALAPTVIAVIHVPLVSSSKMHAQQGARLWSLRHEGVTLPQILADGGVDVILSGHTHTYERFVLTSPAGHPMHLINVSGRPRDSFLWWGSGRRQARDIAGEEIEDLGDRGWTDLDGWKIEQREALTDDAENQWAVLRWRPERELSLQMHFLEKRGKEGWRSDEEQTLPTR